MGETRAVLVPVAREKKSFAICRQFMGDLVDIVSTVKFYLLCKLLLKLLLKRNLGSDSPFTKLKRLNKQILCCRVIGYFSRLVAFSPASEGEVFHSGSDEVDQSDRRLVSCASQASKPPESACGSSSMDKITRGRDYWSCFSRVHENMWRKCGYCRGGGVEYQQRSTSDVEVTS
jgi:hypothetical protein